MDGERKRYRILSVLPIVAAMRKVARQREQDAKPEIIAPSKLARSLAALALEYGAAGRYERDALDALARKSEGKKVRLRQAQAIIRFEGYVGEERTATAAYQLLEVINGERPAVVITRSQQLLFEAIDDFVGMDDESVVACAVAIEPRLQLSVESVVLASSPKMGKNFALPEWTAFHAFVLNGTGDLFGPASGARNQLQRSLRVQNRVTRALIRMTIGTSQEYW